MPMAMGDNKKASGLKCLIQSPEDTDAENDTVAGLVSAIADNLINVFSAFALVISLNMVIPSLVD